MFTATTACVMFLWTLELRPSTNMTAACSSIHWCHLCISFNHKSFGNETMVGYWVHNLWAELNWNITHLPIILVLWYVGWGNWIAYRIFALATFHFQPFKCCTIVSLSLDTQLTKSTHAVAVIWYEGLCHFLWSKWERWLVLQVYILAISGGVRVTLTVTATS